MVIKLVKLYVLVAQNTPPDSTISFRILTVGLRVQKGSLPRLFHRFFLSSNCSFDCTICPVWLSWYPRDCPCYCQNEADGGGNNNKDSKGRTRLENICRDCLCYCQAERRWYWIGVNNKDRKWENAPGWILSDSILRILTQPWQPTKMKWNFLSFFSLNCCVWKKVEVEVPSKFLRSFYYSW